MVVCCDEILLVRLSSGALVIFLGFDISYLLGFALIFFEFSLEGPNCLCILLSILDLLEDA